MKQQIFVDVREPAEFAQDHVDGAINISPSDLLAGAEALKNTPKDTEIVLYCVTGSRSAASIQVLKDQGFTSLVNGINKHHVRHTYELGNHNT